MTIEIMCSTPNFASVAKHDRGSDTVNWEAAGLQGIKSLVNP